MLARRHSNRRRPAMTLVESAMVLTIFLMLLFGIFEYGRFLLVLHVTTNAARDGSRYAAVNVSKPSTFNTTDYTDPAGTTWTNISDYTKQRMGGVNNQIGAAVTVFPCDSTKLNQTPPVVQSKASPTTWNSASFTEFIAVQITGTYTPFLPALLKMPTTIPITITGISGSEG